MDADGPEKWGDWVLFTAAVLAAVPFVLANAVILLYRKRRYFQVEGVDLIIGSSTAGLIWIAATFVVDQHFKRQHLLGRCALWTYWLQLCFGFCLWLVCLAVRLHRLYLLCSRLETLSSRVVWGRYVPLLLVPAIAFSAAATKFSGLGMRGNRCVIEDWRWKLAAFLVVPPLYFSLILLLAVRLRAQTDFVVSTEFRHTSEYSIMAFVIYLLVGTTYADGKQKAVAGRAFLTFCVCNLVFSHFWVRMGYPVYLCLFKPQSAMDKYEEELRLSGAKCLETLRIYSLLSNRNQQGAVGSLHLPLDGPGLIRAIEEAKFEAAALKTRAEELEMKAAQLEEQVSLLSSRQPPATDVEEGVDRVEDGTAAKRYCGISPKVSSSQDR